LYFNILNILIFREKDGEIQLTDAIERLNTNQDVYGFKFEGKRFDVKDNSDLLKRSRHFSLVRPDL